jgi:hypothetical protein
MRVREGLHFEALGVALAFAAVVESLPNRYVFATTQEIMIALSVAVLLAVIAVILSARGAWHGYEMAALVTLCSYLTLFTCISVTKQVQFALTHRAADVEGLRLVGSVVTVWLLNVLTFALWYWTLDREVPRSQESVDWDRLDFLFTPMTIPELKAWRPTFLSYLFLSFCTSTAFGPADTQPLTDRAKVLMMTEALISLIVLAVAAARAIGILT